MLQNVVRLVGVCCIQTRVTFCRMVPPPTLLPAPPFCVVLSLLHLPLSRRVSRSGHPAHHNQMAKESPQLCLSASQPCAVHDLLKGGTVGPPCMHARVCLCVSLPPFAQQVLPAQGCYRASWSMILIIFQPSGEGTDGGKETGETERLAGPTVKLNESVCRVCVSVALRREKAQLQDGLSREFAVHWGDSLEGWEISKSGGQKDLLLLSVKEACVKSFQGTVGREL